VVCQFTEPAAAVGSPSASVEGERYWSFRKEIRERSQLTPLGRQL